MLLFGGAGLYIVFKTIDASTIFICFHAVYLHRKQENETQMFGQCLYNIEQRYKLMLFAFPC